MIETAFGRMAHGKEMTNSCCNQKLLNLQLPWHGIVLAGMHNTISHLPSSAM